MPFFRYSATDKSGVETSGTIEASTPDDATKQLLKQGLSVSLILRAPDTGAPPSQRPNPPKTVQQTTKPQPQPKPSQPSPRPAATVTKAPTPKTKPPAGKGAQGASLVRTKPSNNKDMMLLFSQLAKQIKAGMGPAAALSDLRSRVPEKLSASLEEASKAATNGQPISEVLARYPDLYTESIVGMIRAAEAGGFLEEGLELLSDQTLNAHQFSRSFWWVRWVFVNAIVALPLAILFFQSIVATWKAVDKQSDPNMGTALQALGSSIFSQLIWPIGPITLLLYGGSWWLYRWIRSYEMRRRRHELILNWPVFGTRAKHECLAVFAWVMSKLSNSGISPKSSWEMAAAAVPNIAVKERLERVGLALAGHEKLSDAIFRERLFPPEYATIITTAEHTGDMPAAFDQLSKISKAEFDEAQVSAKTHATSWGRVGCFLTGGILMILLMYTLYYQLYPAILSGFE